jgi:hypothetical protein
MYRTRLAFRQSIVLPTAILVWSCLISPAAVGQLASSGSTADCSRYASVPLPAEAEKTAVPAKFPACGSYRSYRGIGRPANHAEARACAWQERLAQKADLRQSAEEPIAWVVGGSLILADIYFNGAGVERNVPLAMRFVCESEVGMAALAQSDIAKFDGLSRAQRKPFEFCDYAASTFTMVFCSRYASEIEDERRDHYYRKLKVSMTPQEKVAFESLLVAANAYFAAHAAEVYQGGTIRGIRTIGSQNILKDVFHANVVHFERKIFPKLSEKQIADADALLQREYKRTVQRLERKTKEDIEEGAGTVGHLSHVEITWEIYRNAWVTFAGLRYASAMPAIRARVTLDRYRLLKTMQ